ncbi:hypothetical protein FACS1894177_04270 [Bacteroidia bacterium]|nr:hypothetical protein FACS1894177_04270 [Bacteroidia bacterium]
MNVMRKIVLITLLAVVAMIGANAQTTHLLKFEELWNTIKAEAEAGGPATLVENNKYLLNDDRTIGIFLLKSPSNRTFRIDKENIGFDNGITTTVRLEPNGASNTSNGRKIYIACPTAGTLTVGAYTTTAGRGYALEKEDGTILDNTNASLNARADASNMPVQTFTIVEAGTVVLNPNAGIYYGFVQFVESGSNGINTINAAKEVKSVEYYDLTGKKLNNNTVDKGTVWIEKTIYMDGTSSNKKIVK